MPALATKKCCNLRDVPVPPDDGLEDVGEVLVGQAHDAQPTGVLGCLVGQDPPLDLPEVAQAVVPSSIGQLLADCVYKRETWHGIESGFRILLKSIGVGSLDIL